MNDETTSHHRRSIRLQGYDYVQAGAYFATICTQQRVCLFGEIVNGEMQLNEAGKMIHAVWHQLPVRFDTLELDEFVVMPNHIHGILVLQEGDSKTGNHKDHPYTMRNINCRGESYIRP
jgi:REP element-mobilizing transposase RayT